MALLVIISAVGGSITIHENFWEDLDTTEDNQDYLNKEVNVTPDSPPTTTEVPNKTISAPSTVPTTVSKMHQEYIEPFQGSMLAGI